MIFRNPSLPTRDPAARAFHAAVRSFALLGFVAALKLSATTYYVDFASGSDANSGTTASTAWKHVPGDDNANSTPAGKALIAGDKVLFKGGVAYVGSIALKWSGASGNPIIYDGTTWNGTPAIVTTNNAPGTTGFSDVKIQRNYVTIRGILFRDIGGYAENDPIWSTTTAVTAPPGGAGIALLGGSTNIVIENSQFSEIGQWQNKIPMSGTGSVTGAGVQLQNNSNIRIASCDFTRMKTGVSIKATTTISDITVQGSSFHNYMNWLIDIAPYAAGATFQNITIDGCSFYNYKEFDTPNWQGYGEKPHQDGIFLRTGGTFSIWNNVVIRNTKFYSDQTSNGGTASIFVDMGPSVDIYNCIFLNDVHANAYVNVGETKPAGMTQKVRIWNNTFVGGTRAVKVTPANTNADYIDIRNNAFVRQTTYDVVTVAVPQITTLVMDNNVFYGGDSNRAVYDGSSYLTLAAWKLKSGKDANSIWGDPKFVSTIGAPSTWDVRPASTSSPLVGAGADLSAYFTTTIDSLLRSNSWDIGPFAYGAAYTLLAPSNLRLQVP